MHLFINTDHTDIFIDREEHERAIGKTQHQGAMVDIARIPMQTSQPHPYQVGEGGGGEGGRRVGKRSKISYVTNNTGLLTFLFR